MLFNIRNLLKKKEAKTLLENFISLSSLQLVGMILPLITLPYILRTIGIERYGVIVLSTSLINYFTSVTDYSFKITATRDVAVFRNSKKKLDLIYSKVLTVKTILFLFSIASIVTIVYMYPPFYGQKVVFFLTMPMLLGYVIFPEWFFQGIEQMKYITFLNVGIKIFFTICIFIFVKSKEDFWIYPLLQSLGFIGAGIVGQCILIRKYKLKFIFLKKSHIFNTLRSNFPIFINQFFPTLYNNTSTFLLGVLTNNSMVGIYDAIKKIIDLIFVLTGIVSRVFFPFLNRRNDAFAKYMKGMMVLGSILSLMPILFYKLLFWYLNISYDLAFPVLSTLSVGIIFVTLYDIFGVNYFIIKRQDRLVMTNTLIASAVGFLCSFPLIHYFGILGAALNLTIARAIMGLGLLRKYLLLK